MLQCWNKDRLKRPRFTNILQKVEEWLKNPDTLTEIASVITKRLVKVSNYMIFKNLLVCFVVFL